MKITTSEARCEYCNHKLTQPPIIALPSVQWWFTIKIFCSVECRAAWWEKHKK